MPEYESLFARRSRPPPIRLSTSISEVFRPIVREGAVGVGGCRWFGVSGRVVVPESAWSYLRGALRYDRVELRTTGSAGGTTACGGVRPRGAYGTQQNPCRRRDGPSGRTTRREPAPSAGTTTSDPGRQNAAGPGPAEVNLRASRKRRRRTTQPRGRHSHPPRDRQPAPRREKTRTTVRTPPTTPPQHEEPAFLNGLRGSSRQRRRYERAWRSMEWGKNASIRRGHPLKTSVNRKSDTPAPQIRIGPSHAPREVLPRIARSYALLHGRTLTAP